MRIVRSFVIILALTLSAFAQTTVTEPLILTPIGATRFTGNIVITAPNLVYGGLPYAQWIQRIPVVNGLVAGAAFSIALIPNVGATPAGTSYTVKYEPQYQVGLGNQSYTRYWVVPASGPVSIAAVQTSLPASPSANFLPAQIDFAAIGGLVYGGPTTLGVELAPNTTATRKYLSMLSSVLTWEEVAAGGGSWGTITGTLSAQTDLNTALGLKAPIASPTFTGTTTGTFSGALTGNASTATALAANGANCSAGSYPLGVDASGAAEGCTVAGGSAAFSDITSATNTTAAMIVGAGATLNPTSATAGVINANQLNTVSLAGLATGLLKNTTTTGQPSIAVAGTDFVGGQALLDTAGYIPFVNTAGLLTIDKTAAGQLWWDATNHGLHIGNVTASTYKVDISNLRVWDQTSGTGSTSVLFKGGAANTGSHNIFEIQRTNAAIVFRVTDSSGTSTFIGQSNAFMYFGSDRIYLANPPAGGSGGFLKLDSLGKVVWDAATGLGGNDLAIARNAAGIAEINSGTAGAFRALKVSDITVQDVLATTGSSLLSILKGAADTVSTNTFTSDASGSFTGNLTIGAKFYLAQQTPASAAATCTINQFAYDTGFVYVCTATDTWKRAAIATW